MLLIGVAVSALMLGPTPSPESIKSHAAWLLVPATIRGILELIGREGWDWKNAWLARAAGAVVWAAAVVVVLLGISAAR